MQKRALDITIALLLLLITSPLLIMSLLLIWRQDKAWPLYSPTRIGKHGTPFSMHKLRTMIVGADKNRIDTTSLNDSRITPLGHFLRRYKLDELPQLFNILRGEMSLVGPRPQIDREVALYTSVERGLLATTPGITDFSSIIFADLADIVASEPDPNIAYNQLVRPWKSRLGLFYIEHRTFSIDIALIALTALAIISKKTARTGVIALLQRSGAPQELIHVCKRETPLTPTPPPGSNHIVTSRGA